MTIQYQVMNPQEFLEERMYDGKGIITASSNKFMFQTLISINILRDTGCTLPIELYYADVDEINQADIVTLELTLDVKCINIQSFEKFKDYKARNFSIKSIALYLSSFDETIWMDADIIPIINFEELFETDHYKKNNHIFFNDIFAYDKYENAMTKKTKALYKSFNIDIPFGTPETDSGLYVIHKNKFSKNFILINTLLNMDQDTYTSTYGDKELYRLSMDICDSGYFTTIDTNPCIIGKYFKSEDIFCGNAVILMIDLRQICVHMTLHSVDHVNKYNNIWKTSFWTNFITRPVDVELKMVEPLNQEILVKFDYDKKFIIPISPNLVLLQNNMYNYVDKFINNYLDK